MAKFQKMKTKPKNKLKRKKEHRPLQDPKGKYKIIKVDGRNNKLRNI